MFIDTISISFRSRGFGLADRLTTSTGSAGCGSAVVPGVAGSSHGALAEGGAVESQSLMLVSRLEADTETTPMAATDDDRRCQFVHHGKLAIAHIAAVRLQQDGLGVAR